MVDISDRFSNLELVSKPLFFGQFFSYLVTDSVPATKCIIQIQFQLPKVSLRFTINVVVLDRF
jgi:hypothetical protein